MKKINKKKALSLLKKGKRIYSRFGTLMYEKGKIITLEGWDYTLMFEMKGSKMELKQFNN